MKGMKPGLLYKLIGHLCQFINRSMQKPLNRDRCTVLAECLSCLELILVSNHQLVEVHLALMSQIETDSTNSNTTTRDDQTKTQTDDSSDALAAKLERMMGSGGLKLLPNVSQSRVTYFYDKDSYQSSARISGQATPSSFAAQLMMGDCESSNASLLSRSWLVSFCLAHASISASASPSTVSHAPFVLKCFDLLSIVCKKYFDLLSRDLFFEQFSSLIVKNIDFQRTCKPKKNTFLISKSQFN